MAETFGAVASALSIVALFNNCVEAFEYIQLGRHFGRDFTRCQLKLDVARTRLSRWGQAAAIYNDHRFAAITPPDRLSQHIRAILEEIDELFQVVQKSSKRYEIDATQENLECCTVTTMDPPARIVHDRLVTIATQRQKHTGLLKKVSWALYGAKNFDKLIEQITGFIDDLEKVSSPETGRYRQLVDLEIEEIDEQSLGILHGATAGVDQALSEAVHEKLEVLVTRNRIENIRMEHSARVRVGNEWSSDALPYYRTDATGEALNQVGSVAASGKSRIHVGQKYGGQGIFDD
ncbi:uncharacterized protein J7T55_007998 [Diaporthe amygdali]|uniref:uncharacterized protein n=1 Tax=Phomopsis amygdali TaxID=1214568 RepID=UPI0022FEB18D|nr:uncharacterized protein J7T55_007998 [Diaporthe amygdali]KAJ0114163.1 uncharacterized protein J7T55_007998 [Diaporthe amygdali]